jgi:hypothetical protein
MAEPHKHMESELVGLEGRFVQHGEEDHPHVHSTADIRGLDEFRGDTSILPHQHVLADVADHDILTMSLWRHVLEGIYGG